MTDLLAARAIITRARAAINQAAKSDPGHWDLEGDFENADLRLGDALAALHTAETTADYDYDEDDYGYVDYGYSDFAVAVSEARAAIEEALELLDTPDSRVLAEDPVALDTAIRLLRRINRRL